MSWKPLVRVANEPDWKDNALRFATKREAIANVQALGARWFAVVGMCVIESPDPPNYMWIDGKLAALPTEPAPLTDDQLSMFDLLAKADQRKQEQQR